MSRSNSVLKTAIAALIAFLDNDTYIVCGLIGTSNVYVVGSGTAGITRRNAVETP
jgi:hypothetical protein